MIDLIDSVFFALIKAWERADLYSYESRKLRRGYWEMDFGEWIFRKYVWGDRMRFEVDNGVESSYIERVGDTYRNHGSWEVLQKFLDWAEQNGLI